MRGALAMRRQKTTRVYFNVFTSTAAPNEKRNRASQNENSPVSIYRRSFLHYKNVEISFFVLTMLIVSSEIFTLKTARIHCKEVMSEMAPDYVSDNLIFYSFAGWYGERFHHLP